MWLLCRKGVKLIRGNADVDGWVFCPFEKAKGRLVGKIEVFRCKGEVRKDAKPCLYYGGVRKITVKTIEERWESLRKDDRWT